MRDLAGQLLLRSEEQPAVTNPGDAGSDQAARHDLLRGRHACPGSVSSRPVLRGSTHPQRPGQRTSPVRLYGRLPSSQGFSCSLDRTPPGEEGPDRKKCSFTTGSQQALDLFAWSMIDKGDYVITEDPSYLQPSLFSSTTAAAFSASPRTGNGMQVDLLPGIIEKARSVGKEDQFILHHRQLPQSRRIYHCPWNVGKAGGDLQYNTTSPFSKTTPTAMSGTRVTICRPSSHSTTRGRNLRRFLLEDPLPGPRVGGLRDRRRSSGIHRVQAGDGPLLQHHHPGPGGGVLRERPPRPSPPRDHRQLQGEA